MLVVKKCLKILLWITGSIAALFIIIALAIQIPSIQNFLIHKATTFVSNKTHTKVEIGRIGIIFPKSVFIDDLFLEDKSHDTLLYSENMKVNLDMIALLNGNINLQSVSLENLTGNITRKENDSFFNYNFLLSAFSDSSQKTIEKNEKSKSKEFSIGNINLKEIKITYDDKYNGLLSKINLKELRLEPNKINLTELKFDVNELFIDGLNGSIVINKKSVSDKSLSSNPLPEILLDKLEIKNSSFILNDKISSEEASSRINQLVLNKANVNLNSEIISLDKILSDQNYFSLSLIEKKKKDSIISSVDNSKSNWKINIKNIQFSKNQFAYNVINTPVIENAFDSNHLNYKNLSIVAEDVYYSSEETKANIKNISVDDLLGISMKNLAVNFKMNEHSVSAKNLKLKTNNSDICTSLELKYSSLASLKDSLQNMFVNASIHPTLVSAKDVLYFSPQLKDKPFFNHLNNSFSFSVNISGQIKNLKGDNFSITSGTTTSLKTDFHITGLPDTGKMYFDIPNFKIITSRNDLYNLLGENIFPKYISLPSNINLNGKFKGRLKEFESLLNIETDYGKLSASINIDKQENFSGNFSINDFNAGLLLKDTNAFGPVTIKGSINGKGLDKNSLTADVKVNSSSITLNKYAYQNLSVDGKISGQQFDGNISLKDTNASFDFNGLVNVTPGQEQYKFSLNIEGADLQKLNFSKDDLRISAIIFSDLEGKDINSITGNAGITKIMILKHGEKYRLDSLLFASVNEKGKKEMSISSAIIGIKYNGTFAPANIASEIKRQINNYFPVINEKEIASVDKEPQNFSFEIQLHNHPLLSEVFFPKLTEFDPGIIKGNFDSEKSELIVNADISKIIYSGIEVDNLNFKINTDKDKFSYAFTTENISTAQINLSNFSISGNFRDQKAFVGITSLDESGNKKLWIKTVTEKKDGGLRINFSPDDFYLGNQQWNLPADNYVSIGDKGILFHNLTLTKSSDQINIASVNNKYNDDIKIEIKNFDLNDVSRIFEKDTTLVEGNLNADVLLKRINNNYGLIANAELKDLSIKKINVGSIEVKAENPTTEKFTVDAKLVGLENNVFIKGYFIPRDSSKNLNLSVEIQSLSLKTVEAFSMGQIKEGSGIVKGNFTVEGNSGNPEINGNLVFNDTYFRPAVLNNRLHFKNEKIELKPTGIYFDNFTITDEKNHSAQINGEVTMKQFSDYRFALNINTDDFLLFNTTGDKSKFYYGKMIIDSRIKLNGTPDFPVIESKVKLKKESDFTFGVPENDLTSDKGEGVVLFVDSLKLNPILTRNEKVEKQKSGLKGFDISSEIEIDDKATLHLLIDPTTKDSLVVKGAAALSLRIDPSGKISLTGTYSLTEGSYIVSLQSLIKKKFEIEPGSTISWNGDPLDAEVNLTAIYTVRTSAIDLVADEISGLSESDKNIYRERLNFLVYLRMQGELKHPELSFEIQLPPEDKGALSGSVNAKLNQLNDDQSKLNKQVFALLVLGRFIQENPLNTEGKGNASESLARNSVSSFLTTQLNQLGSKVLPGVELNFNVQSYEDYTTGDAEGRTQVDVGLRNQLFSQRLTVQVGGTFDVEGEKAKQNTSNSITGNVAVEYKLTDDGRYRLKGYSENVYHDPLEGELIETGGGILYTRDFNTWKDLFTRPEKKEEDKNVTPENK